MYESLVSWCRFPVNIYNRTGFSVSGDPIEAALVTKNGYRVDKIQTIIDKTGKEYISHTQVYFPPEVAITVDDRVSFPNDLKQREIKKLDTFNDGNTGTVSIQVIYL